MLYAGASSAGPYAPAGGQSGSVAISATDSRIVEWASGATINRGLADIADPSLGYATYGGPNGSGTSQNMMCRRCRNRVRWRYWPLQPWPARYCGEGGGSGKKRIRALTRTV